MSIAERSGVAGVWADPAWSVPSLRIGCCYKSTCPCRLPGVRSQTRLGDTMTDLRNRPSACREFWRLLRGRASLLMLSVLGMSVCCAAGVGVSVASGAPVAQPGGAGGGSSGVRSLSVGGGSGLGTRGSGPTVPANGVAVPALFTATSRTYKSSQGTYTTTVYNHVVNVKEASGVWKPIVEGVSSSSSARRGRSPASAPKIDASVTSGVSQDCPLASSSAKTSLCSSTSDTVGYDGTNTDNSLVQFNVKEALPAGANVLNAQLGMYLWQSSTKTAVSVSAYAATKAWTSSATWSAYDGINAWTSPGGDFSTTNAVVNPSVTTPAGWEHWYPTQIVQEWVNGTLPNDGLVLADTTQHTTNDMLSFYSSKASSSEKPYLTISWVPRGQEDPGFYSMQSFALGDRATIKVNLASGNLFVNSNDLAVKGLGVPFLAEHNYDSVNTEGGSVNPWYSLPGASVYADGSVGIGINRYDYSVYIRKSDGSFLTPAGINATLCAVNGTTCTANSVDGSGAAYALTFNENGNGPLYKQGNKIDFASNGGFESDADRYGNAIVFHYGENLTVTDTQGHTFTRHTIKAPGGFYVTSSWVESGAGGREVKYAYNAGSQLETYTDALGQKTKYAYDEEGELSEITDPKGNVTKFSYSHRQITKIILPEVGGAHPDWDYAYYVGSDTEHGHACTAVGVTKKTVVKDPNGHESTFCANVQDEVLQSFDAAGSETTANFNSLGETTSTTAASPGSGESGNVSSLVYQEAGAGAGRPMCAITGATKQQTSCPSGAGGSMLVTAFNYKDEKNPYLATQIKNPQGNSTFSCFNQGKQEGSEGPACPGTATGPAGSVQNINDQLSTEHELSFEYNTNGTIKTSKDARGTTTTYEYDEKGNLKAIKPPEGKGLGKTTITVDSDSRPHVVTDGAGHIETITYDKLDRVTEIVYSGTGTAKTVKYEYDSDGNVAKRVDSTGTTTYTVDALNRVTKEELPGSLKNEYGYDAASNMISFVDGGGTTKYKFNNLNELESMTEPGESTETKFSYDNDHRLTKIAYPSGAKETYKLEATTGRPETITFEGVTGTTVPNLTYSYIQGTNNTQLIRKLTESTNNSTTYGYDVLNRLTSAISTGTGSTKYNYSFTLDGNGNRTQQTTNPTESTGGVANYFPTNANNLLECRQTVTGACSKNSSTELSAYTFDEAGEETAITPKSDTSGSTFAYNAASELFEHHPIWRLGSGALLRGHRPRRPRRRRQLYDHPEQPPRADPRSQLLRHQLLRTHPQRTAYRPAHPVGQVQPALRRAGRYHRARELQRQSRTHVPLWSLRRERQKRRHTNHPLPVWVQERLPDPRRQQRARERNQRPLPLRSALLRPDDGALDAA